MVFIRVSIDSHSEKEAKKFEEEVTALDYVVACYSIGGDADFLLQVVSPDLDTYAEFSMSIIRRLPNKRNAEYVCFKRNKTIHRFSSEAFSIVF
jgi:DNA-binding Lrp family transcriptional regulator